MTKTRAKFVVTGVSNQGSPTEKYSERVTLSAVYSPDPESENRAFWTATPSGHLDLYITNPAAWGFFVAGQEYYLDFVPA